MKAEKILREMFSWAPGEYAKTCDTLKAGDPSREVTKAAVCCFAAPKIIREAAAWGAQLLITHEPLYYNHWDDPADPHAHTPAAQAKKALLEQTGLTVYRYHDHPHNAPADMICQGELAALGLPGRLERLDYFGTNCYHLDAPITPRELAAHIEKALGIAHVRICGTLDEPCTRVTTAFGTPGGVFEELSGPAEIVLTGEACEWQLGEYARDASELGMKKALLILGHCGSEREGMRCVAERMKQALPQIETRYFESEEVYHYPEQA